MDYIELTAQRLREMDRWTEANPPESGIVKITRDKHGAFWKAIEARRGQ